MLRQGDVCTFTLDSLVNGSGVYNSSIPFQYRLDMLEPVMQGYAQRGETKIILTVDTSLQQREADYDSEPEGFEIDEHFLAPAAPSLAIVSQSSENKPLSFECQALEESGSQLYEDCTLYLRTTDLGRVGGLNGDWVRFPAPRFLSRGKLKVDRLSSTPLGRVIVGSFMLSPMTPL